MEIKIVKDEFVTFYFNSKGQIHRDGDLPAIEYNTHDQKSWFINGKRHRDNNLPAEENPNFKAWWKNGLRHRDNDQPAIEYKNGIKEWWKDGVQYFPSLQEPDNKIFY